MTAKLNDSASPVFILSCARSGSTLLRYLLDAHAELACPTETTIPHLSLQLATVWATICGAAKPAMQPASVAAIPEPVIAQVRQTIDSMMEHYLAKRGKRRFCDKSLGSARYADLLMRLYPQARFVCVTRHAMDVVMSALEANPWGPIGYGLDEYVPAGSGNMVDTLARYWIDHTNAITSAALRYPGNSCLLRYEDLVDAPEMLARRIFGFLGVPPQPGISREFLRDKQERLGLGDHKIWWTSEISSRSIGRGQAVPPALLTASVRDEMNALLSRLGYAQVEPSWGTADGPDDPRRPDTRPLAERRPSPQAALQAAGLSSSLEERLRRGLCKVDDSFAARWQSCSADRFACVSRPRNGRGEAAHWLIDLPSRTLTRTEPGTYEWCVLGEPDAWEAVLSGKADLGSALRRGQLRYCEGLAAGVPATSARSARSAEVPVTEDRVDMVGELLGLTPWLASEVG